MPLSAARGVGLAVMLLLGAIASTARADGPDEKESCASAFERGQELERAGQLQAAQQSFVRCAAPTCPAVLIPHCVGAVQRVEAQIPSIVIAARGSSGEEIGDVRVLVDGALRAERLDGKAIPIDPGSHRIRFERPGMTPVERDVLIRVGERNRAIDVSFATPKTPEPPRDAPPPLPPRDAPPAPPPRSPLAVPAIVALSAGGVAVTLGAVAGALALANKMDLDRTCPTKATCDPSLRGQIDAMKTQSKIATAGLALGAAGLALGAVFLVIDRRAPRAARTSVLLGPGSIHLQGAF